MFEDERQEERYQNGHQYDDNNYENQDIKNKQDHIFVEEDVEIPEETVEPNFENRDTTYRKSQSEIPFSRFEERKPEPNQYSYIPNDVPSGKKQEKRRVPRQERNHRKHMNNYAKAIVCAVLCGVIVGGCVIGSFAIGQNLVQSPPTPSVPTNQEKLIEKERESEVSTTKPSNDNGYTVSQIANECGPSVVAITNKGISEVRTMFGTYQQESQGSGSGVIVSVTEDELLVVTNYHVIEGANELTVCFNDSADAVYNAQVKGTDAANDLAVVAVKTSDISKEVLDTISVATVGDSESLQVGDGVVAIGNALGLGRSVTSGIVSALDREVTIEDNTSTLLQTDAAINPGNSGGALLNMKGELIGINSAKFASAQIEGMGFAIPMATAEPIIKDLMTKETRTKLTKDYGCLNIKGGDVSAEAISMYGIPEGVYVSSVFEGLAADKAGMKEGDIITSLEGTALTGIADLKSELQYYKAGETVELVIQRNEGNGYEEKKISVTLDNASEQEDTTSSGQDSQNGQDFYDFGGSEGNGFNFW